MKCLPIHQPHGKIVKLCPVPKDLSLSFHFRKRVRVSAASLIFLAAASSVWVLAQSQVRVGYAILAPDAGGGNGPTTSASLNHPEAAACDSAGNLDIADSSNHRIWIADFVNNRIRRLNLNTRVITTVAGSNTAPLLDNVSALQTALCGPTTTLMDAQGNLFIIDFFGRRIRGVRRPIP